MAKRKRLTPAQPGYLVQDTKTPVSETKPAGLSAAAAAGRPPIAQVSGAASTAAALEELAGEMNRARDEGRLIQALPLDAVEAGYLVRDRMLADEDELQVLMESLRARGQQTPVEVVALRPDRYGLISGWRRLTALKRLQTETGDDRFASVLAILRQPDGAADAYVAMVEENEIRVGLSHYERARIAAKAVEQGAYARDRDALRALFAAASRAKRSKIGAFLPIYRALDPVLSFPMAIPERLGLALGRALEDDPALAGRLEVALLEAAPGSAEAELAVLKQALKPAAKQSLTPPVETESEDLFQVRRLFDRAGGVTVIHDETEDQRQGRITLTGETIDAALCEELLAWLRRRG